MAYSPVENKYLSALTSLQFPDEQPAPEVAAAPEKPMAPGQRPGDILVAEVGSRGLPEQAYSGQKPAQMTAYDPTVRERLAGFLQAGFEGMGVDRFKARQNAQTILGGPSSNLPLNLGLADVVPFLGTGLQTQEAVRMGEEAGYSAQAGNYGTAAMQAGGAAIGLIPGVGGTVKAAKPLIPKAAEMTINALEKTGMPARGLGIVESGPNVVSTRLPTAVKATAPVNDMGFYSAVEQAALNIPRKSGTGQAMLNDITKGQDVKLDEVKWIGLDDFLKGKKNVTREEVQEYIAANKVDVQEVEFGNLNDIAVQKEQAAAGNLVDLINAQEGSSIRLAGTQGKVFSDEALYALQDGTTAPNQFPPEFQEAANSYLMAHEATKEASNTYTKFGKYTLPGGENYREILLTMPFKEPAMPKGYEVTSVQYDDGTFRYFANTPTTRSASYKTEADAMSELQRMVSGLKGFRENQEAYRSSHWDEKNVLAHIRVNDRVDADGKKMLLVEEVQSDWHQAGRDKGYAGADAKQAEQEFKTYATELASKYDLNPEQNLAMYATMKRMQPDEVAKYEQLQSAWVKSKDGVPDAPMKDTWYQLALKRVLKYAADNGYERVGLTTGKTNADRFDLSKQLDAVEYKRNPDGGGVIIADDKSGKTVMQQRINSDEQLADYIGKEASKKLLSQKPMANNNSDAMSYVLNNADLSVGGEGMKKYYDEIYPQFLAKYGKKWGAKVGDTQIKVGADQVEPGIAAPGIGVEFPSKTTPAPMEKVRFVDITPEMRQGVGKGQPLFTATGIGAGTTGATMQDKEQK